MIIIKIDGEIVGKGRPKFARRGNFVSTYTPQKTCNYENLVKICYEEQNRDNNTKIKFFNKEPLKLTINAYFDIPLSFSNKKRKQALNGEIYPTKKPDFDNIAKIITDALNKVAYSDDSQIVECIIKKQYSNYSFVEITIEEIKSIVNI